MCAHMGTSTKHSLQEKEREKHSPVLLADGHAWVGSAHVRKDGGLQGAGSSGTAVHGHQAMPCTHMGSHTVLLVLLACCACACSSCSAAPIHPSIHAAHRHDLACQAAEVLVVPCGRDAGEDAGRGVRLAPLLGRKPADACRQVTGRSERHTCIATRCMDRSAGAMARWDGMGQQARNMHSGLRCALARPAPSLRHAIKCLAAIAGASSWRDLIQRGEEGSRKKTSAQRWGRARSPFTRMAWQVCRGCAAYQSRLR